MARPFASSAGAACAVDVVAPRIPHHHDLVVAHPGTVEVHLQLQSGGRTTVMRLDDRLRVTPSQSLFADLKALLGPGCLAGS